ncbi:acylphosphatase [Mycetocola sp.]|uniref:acylphosphatase n=1 Tax=Mycetocola sp. TaxID=1871042 RepID=UPI003989C583
MGNIRRRVLVRGRVQGVGFRYWARSKAEHFGVHGWVRNRSDGSVEAEVEGEPGAVSEMIKAIGRGPAGAVVSDVEVSDLPPDGEVGFHIRPGDRSGMSGWFRRG